jgi:pilus assembly protein CpaC
MLAAEVIPVTDGAASAEITLRSSGAIIVQSDVPFDEFELGNPYIASISPVTDSTIYLLGKEAGRTTLTLLRNDGQPATLIQVHVSPNMESDE